MFDPRTRGCEGSATQTNTGVVGCNTIGGRFRQSLDCLGRLLLLMLLKAWSTLMEFRATLIENELSTEYPIQTRCLRCTHSRYQNARAISNGRSFRSFRSFPNRYKVQVLYTDILDRLVAYSYIRFFCSTAIVPYSIVVKRQTAKGTL